MLGGSICWCGEWWGFGEVQHRSYEQLLDASFIIAVKNITASLVVTPKYNDIGVE